MRWTLLLLAAQAACCSAWLPALLERAATFASLRALDALTSLLPGVFWAQRALAPPRGDRSQREEFDFVVVGAGAAGSALAARLSERSDWRVLLLEAGGEEVSVMDVPYFIGQFQTTDANWHYVTTPQNTSCVGLEDSICDYPAGRTVGGSTSINYMFNIRGNAKDFDNWAEMGNEGWSFADVLPYFKKVEDVSIPELQGNQNRGYGGRIKTTYPEYFSEAAQLYLRAAREAGFPAPADYNAGPQTGASRIQTTTFRGSRWSANAGYLDDARKRPNLFVRPRSFATRLIVEGGRARGVRYVRDGVEQEAFATKDVVLSAGAVNSPAILMRSGIGPKGHLSQLGIPLLKDLPVGQNLMDHTCLYGTFTTFNETVTPSAAQNLINPRTYWDYVLFREGPLTTTGAFEALSFHDLEGTPFYSPGWPMVEILFSSINIIPTEKISKTFRISKKTYDRIMRPIEGMPAVLACLWSTRPKSRGRVFLLDDDPFSLPQIDPAGISHPDDIEVVLAGLREYQKIVAADSFQKFGARMVDAPAPGCESFAFDTDDYWRCAIRQLSLTIYHQSGTCKMGPPEDDTAVVTPKLKVVGIEGLRVADASVMPMIITGHLQITSYMIGEKLSDIIKEEYDG